MRSVLGIKCVFCFMFTYSFLIVGTSLFPRAVSPFVPELITPSLFILVHACPVVLAMVDPLDPLRYVPAMSAIWSAVESAVVWNLLSPLNDVVMSNSIMNPIAWSTVVWNPAYAPMSKIGLKFCPSLERKSTAGFLVVAFAVRADVVT